MNWLKDAVLDIIIFGIIVAYMITSNNVVEIILWVYTGFLLIGKILYFFIDFLKSKAVKTNVPNWFYHSIYLLTILLLLISGNYYLTVSWFIVWILSIIANIPKKQIATK